MNREPVLTPAAISSGVAAVVALLVAFGLELSADQTAAIMGVVAVVAPLVVAAVGRSRVTPINDPRDDDGTPLVPLDVD